MYRVPRTAYRVPRTAYRVPRTAYRVPRTAYRQAGLGDLALSIRLSDGLGSPITREGQVLLSHIALFDCRT